MKYKINFISGFKFSFTEIANVFVNLSGEKSINNILTFTAYNPRKTKILLDFLVECELVKRRSLEITHLGKIVRKYDKFFENIGSLWLFHYLLSSKEQLVIWNRLFNNILSSDVKDREAMVPYFEDLKTQISNYTYERNVRKEIKMVIDTYLKERLSFIDLIYSSDAGYSSNENGNIPELIFLSLIIIFRNKYYAGSTAVTINDICYSDNSPGRLCFLDEHYIRTKLERLKNLGLLTLESRADLDQVRLGSELTVENVMEEYYKSI